MIRSAKNSDRKTIYDLHSSNVSVDRYDDMEYYFARLFDADKVIVNDHNSHVVASLQVNYHTMILNDIRVGASTILGQITTEQNKEYFRELMNDVLDEVSRKTLVTLLLTNKPNDYTQYGFEAIYKRKTYNISRSDLKNRSFDGVGGPFEISELVKVFREFASHFNGYYERDNNYWIEAFRQYQFLRRNIVSYRNEEGKVEGYMVYQITQQKIYVDELVYLNGTALIRLICYALKFKNNIEVTVSENEDLSKAMPKIRSTSRTVMMARINDYPLFNKLFESDVRKVREGFGLCDKPLYINERY
ncbi:MAG: GNAT family N-acetyltransferase [Erysipelotrichaceae bacterium]|nr:GNAT family N-acetyltransferase [Erysipelotrichaceae bacterium]